MKRLKNLMFVPLFILGTTAPSFPLTIDWIEFSTTRFEASIQGAGSQSIHTTSPNSLWLVQPDVQLFLGEDPAGDKLVPWFEVEWHGGIVLIGSGLSHLGVESYGDSAPGAGGVIGGPDWASVEWWDDERGIGWVGEWNFEFLSYPTEVDFDQLDFTAFPGTGIDASSWTWRLHFFAAGPAVGDTTAPRVPDAGATAWMLAATLGLLIGARGFRSRPPQ